eukprot:GILK01003064.1.p1 GENE.GILK01003064.1~~GILK01003064.1.p1  ORF type:complete len:491 (+),score=88.45 GILK01003064.1:82-1554(+)
MEALDWHELTGEQSLLCTEESFFEDGAFCDVPTVAAVDVNATHDTLTYEPSGYELSSTRTKAQIMHSFAYTFGGSSNGSSQPFTPRKDDDRRLSLCEFRSISPFATPPIRPLTPDCNTPGLHVILTPSPFASRHQRSLSIQSDDSFEDQQRLMSPQKRARETPTRSTIYMPFSDSPLARWSPVCRTELPSPVSGLSSAASTPPHLQPAPPIIDYSEKFKSAKKIDFEASSSAVVPKLVSETARQHFTMGVPMHISSQLPPIPVFQPPTGIPLFDAFTSSHAIASAASNDMQMAGSIMPTSLVFAGSMPPPDANPKDSKPRRGRKRPVEPSSSSNQVAVVHHESVPASLSESHVETSATVPNQRLPCTPTKTPYRVYRPFDLDGKAGLTDLNKRLNSRSAVSPMTQSFKLGANGMACNFTISPSKSVIALQRSTSDSMIESSLPSSQMPTSPPPPLLPSHSLQRTVSVPDFDYSLLADESSDFMFSDWGVS